MGLIVFQAFAVSDLQRQVHLETNDQTPIKQKLNYVHLHFQIIPNKLPCVGDTSIKAKL